MDITAPVTASAGMPTPFAGIPGPQTAVQTGPRVSHQNSLCS